MATKDDLYNEIGKIRAGMAIKDYLDEKLADLRFAPVLSTLRQRK